MVTLKNTFHRAIILIVFIVFFVMNTQPAGATLESCTASVSPSSVLPDSSTSFTVSITNTGSNPILFINVFRPSADFNITSYSAAGWDAYSGNTEVGLYGGSVDVGATYQFTVTATAGSNDAASANWSVKAADVVDPGQTISCTGSLGTAIQGVQADTTPPSISNVSASDVTATTAQISWTTDEASDTYVGYDLSGGYTSNVSDAADVTSHIIQLTGLSANSVYYFQVCSTDTSENQRCDDGNTFTTASASTVVPTSTPVPSSSTSSTVPTPTLTPSSTTTTTVARNIDATRPRISLSGDFDEPFSEAPSITGSASDNVRIADIEYSTDGGVNWLPVDTIEDRNTSSTDFDFVPFIFEDGTYDIQARAIDASGNIGLSEIVTVVIDRLPPQIGPMLYSMGPQALLPGSNGIITTMAGLPQKITLSAIGGPDKIDLRVDDQVFSLVYSPESNLWSGVMIFKQPGLYSMTAEAIDGAGTEIVKELNPVLVVGPGKITSAIDGKPVSSGEVSLYVQDPVTDAWALWDGNTFSQDNPQKLDAEGHYQFFLPPGTYYLDISAEGFAPTRSKIFVIDESVPFNAKIQIEPRKKYSIGPLSINLPRFLESVESVPVSISTPQIPKDLEVSDLVGQELENFVLGTTSGNQLSVADLRGKEWVLSFVSSWAPPAVEQMSVLDNLIQENDFPGVIFSTQESASKMLIFQKRGGYDTSITVDPDGELIEKYELSSLPTHIVINKNGVIENVVSGVLNADELESLIDL